MAVIQAVHIRQRVIKKKKIVGVLLQKLETLRILAIARRLVPLNGGEFKIETEPGGGATIRLFLRLVPGY